MKKRLLSLLLTAGMCAGLLAGCGGGDTASNGSNASGGSGNESSQGSSDAGGEPGGNEADGNEETVPLNMVMISMGLNLEDAGKVQDAINEYLEPLIHATVNIEWLDMGDYVNQMNLKLTGGDVIDVMPTFGSMTSMWYAQDALMPMDDLVQQYGQGVIEAVGENYMVAGNINGQLYAIPCVQSFARNHTLMYRKDLAEQYELDMDSVKSLEDLTPIFEKLHAADPSLTLLVSNNPSDPMLTDWAWDGLGDEYGVILDAENSTEVVNLFETEEYKNLVELMHEWYSAGYIQTDASTTTENMGALLSTGTSFGVIGFSYPGSVEEQSMICSYELAEMELVPALATTNTINSMVMTIPSTSAHPEKAMEFINLLYTDTDLINMLYYGIEGANYQVISDGVVDYMDGENMMTAKYVNKFKIGNQLIGYREKTEPAGINETLEKFNAEAAMSKASGFSYDSASVANQLAALETVAAKYRRGLECGSLDPATELPKFIEELKGAGIDDVVAAKQEQLNTWLQQ